MKSWQKRPREIRNLFNPAFCGVLLMRSIEGYEAYSQEGMPFSLTLPVLPLCLHKSTRDAFKSGAKSYLSKIVDENPGILVGLPERASGLLPFTFEAFGFLMAMDAVEISSTGFVRTKPGGIKKTIIGSDETRDCQLVARSIGRKFATTNDRATIYTTLGIRP